MAKLNLSKLARMTFVLVKRFSKKLSHEGHSNYQDDLRSKLIIFYVFTKRVRGQVVKNGT